MTGEGRLDVLVTPRAAANAVEIEGGTVRVRVTAAPADGRANEAVIRLVADLLGVPKRDIRIASGPSARRKVLAIAGLDAEIIATRLSTAAAKRQRQPRG